MDPIRLAAVITVNFALLAYTVGIVREQRSRRVTLKTLNWLRVGVALDIVATSLMIAASGKVLTIHGALGFSALAAMVLETSFAWRHHARNGDAEVPRGLHTLSRAAYGWWVVAYISGAYLVMAA